MLPKTQFYKPSFFTLHLQFIPSIFHFSTLSQAHETLSGQSLTITKQAFTSLLHSHSSHPNHLKQIHSLLLTTGLSVKNSLITQLLTSLCVLGDMSYARQLFDEMHKPRPFVWNTLIKGYFKNELPNEVASVYRQMHHIDVRPDPFTFPFVVKCCTELSELWVGVAIHAHVLKYGLEFIAMVRTELMVMYVKFGEMGSADYLLESMVEKDLVAWNALISAYAQNGHASRALQLFHQMVVGEIRPDSVTIVSAFSACAHLGCLEIGEEIYGLARKEGIDINVIVDNARLDMYVKCGSIDMARSLFENMHNRNVISWSTMIGGYAMNGESKKALELFSSMQNERVQPNYVTFLGVLSACTHAGLVKEGWYYFNYMVQSNKKDIKPRKEHYACMVDLLGRSGHLNEAYNFIKSMPIEPDLGVWGALLGACTIHHNVALGQHVADSLFELAPDIGSYHVLLSNMYAAAGRWHCVEKVRLKMKKKGAKKVVAYSSVEFNGQIHVLYSGDRLHPQATRIYKKLEQLFKHMKSMGYSPKTSSVLHDVDMEEKEATLNSHSEKLAIAFGLLNVRPELPIRVIKNLRICDDCHTFSKLASEITMREIIMRDKNRFHHFKDGFCSCNDFW
ncbi:pentatricopeptide repeat-containing protein At2g01510, mitochondrial [Cornus florida]|uniref:pentatricopeptide repeat-containing protein At2g01510, mitochondrial n=1 Tax=Cornus florida TaxID=4283 RepID=UPI00289757B2|nr:pentatricopeptide repeat-containing protein At2g01510, mitochondrial [Cornus florida]